jgi:hypothetical protein
LPGAWARHPCCAHARADQSLGRTHHACAAHTVEYSYTHSRSHRSHQLVCWRICTMHYIALHCTHRLGSALRTLLSLFASCAGCRATDLASVSVQPGDWAPEQLCARTQEYLSIVPASPPWLYATEAGEVRRDTRTGCAGGYESQSAVISVSHKRRRAGTSLCSAQQDYHQARRSPTPPHAAALCLACRFSLVHEWH